MVHLLLAEDNKINQKVIIGFCQNKDWTVTVAQNGYEVIDKLKLGSFDIILMDIQMPRMNGIEATKIIRQNYDWQKIPIIAVTAHALRGDEEKFLAAGMDAYIKKPIDFNYLESTINSFINDSKSNAKIISNIEKENSFLKLSKDTGMPINLVIELANDFIEMYNIESKQIIDNVNNPSTVKDIAHKLKGAISNFGFKTLQKLFYSVEVNKSKPEKIVSIILEINKQMMNFKKELKFLIDNN